MSLVQIGPRVQSIDTLALGRTEYRKPDGHTVGRVQKNIHLKTQSVYSAKAGQTLISKLRHFVSLGWIIYIQGDGSWTRTGHVLAVDMDVTRKHHPWFILASEWPSDLEDAEGGFMVSVPQTVPADDPTQPGILSGGSNRTPLGKVIPMMESGYVPVLKQFGPDFDFRVRRPGGDRSHKRDPTRGPDLAQVMHWHWDPATGEEVCFYKDGILEYMRYVRNNKSYTYRSMGILQGLVAGEAGLFGGFAAPGAPPSGWVCP